MSKLLAALAVAAAFTGATAVTSSAQGTAAPGGAPVVEVTPATLEVDVGQEVTFEAAVHGGPVTPLSGQTEEVPSAGGASGAAEGAGDAPDVLWIASPFDAAAADQDGKVTFYQPGNVVVTALVNGTPGFAQVRVRPAKVAKVEIARPSAPLVVGGAAQLDAVARAASGTPREDVSLSWTSETPDVASVDAGGLVTGLATGKATIVAESDGARGTVTVDVVENPVRTLAIESPSAAARSGDVVRLKPLAKGEGGTAIADPFVRWSVSGEGAFVAADGAFVAERPGTYAVTATSGDHVAVTSLVVKPRAIGRALDVVGRAPAKQFQVAEQWIVGDWMYVGTIADRVYAYDVSDPANPVKTDSILVDARTINDVSTTPDGRIGVFTREGASSRKNGIVFFDASDPGHPKVVSEYTETVTGGVHSAFIDGHYVYLTDDATGSMRVIDFSNVKKPREVARWQVENPQAHTIEIEGQFLSGGRYLHDLQIVDGLAYLAYWRDGLVILDVGNGIKGGSPEKPQFVSQLRFNHNELYGPDWLAGTHTVFRYEDYVFVGDEVFPANFDIESRDRIPPRGILHVVDVSDVEHPVKVAEYEVPEGGAHNVWVEDDVLTMGYYTGGGRVLDVSGELRGDLYAQGREISRLFTGDPEGYRPNLPLAWGAQPHRGHVFFNDINSGIWITKLGAPREQGTTTAPGF
ncbi:MAG TPA: Ig-like domain-containing protein [Gemmatimonadota bacterium]|jgi:hypothetical protein